MLIFSLSKYNTKTYAACWIKVLKCTVRSNTEEMKAFDSPKKRLLISLAV